MTLVTLMSMRSIRISKSLKVEFIVQQDIMTMMEHLLKGLRSLLRHIIVLQDIPKNWHHIQNCMTYELV